MNNPINITAGFDGSQTTEETTIVTVLTLPVTGAFGEEKEAFFALSPNNGFLADTDEALKGLVETFKAAHKAEEVYWRHHQIMYPSLTEEVRRVWLKAFNEAEEETFAAYWAIGSYLLIQWEEAKGVTVPKKHRSNAYSIVANAALPLLGLQYGQER